MKIVNIQLKFDRSIEIDLDKLSSCVSDAVQSEFNITKSDFTIETASNLDPNLTAFNQMAFGFRAEHKPVINERPLNVNLLGHANYVQPSVKSSVRRYITNKNTVTKFTNLDNDIFYKEPFVIWLYESGIIDQKGRLTPSGMSEYGCSYFFGKGRKRDIQFSDKVVTEYSARIIEDHVK